MQKLRAYRIFRLKAEVSLGFTFLRVCFASNPACRQKTVTARGCRQLSQSKHLSIARRTRHTHGFFAIHGETLNPLPFRAIFGAFFRHTRLFQFQKYSFTNSYPCPLRGQNLSIFSLFLSSIL